MWKHGLITLCVLSVSLLARSEEKLIELETIDKIFAEVSGGAEHLHNVDTDAWVDVLANSGNEAFAVKENFEYDETVDTSRPRQPSAELLPKDGHGYIWRHACRHRGLTESEEGIATCRASFERLVTYLNFKHGYWLTFSEDPEKAGDEAAWLEYNNCVEMGAYVASTDWEAIEEEEAALKGTVANLRQYYKGCTESAYASEEVFADDIDFVGAFLEKHKDIETK